MLTPAEYWDRESTQPVTPPSHNWMHHPLVRNYINESIGGGTPMWPLDWFQATFPGRRFPAALSIGCGTGALERDLVRRNLVDRIDACDASVQSLNIARAEAAAEGMSDRIRYFEADFNTLDLPIDQYDLICFHQSLHHVAALERLLSRVERALKADGLLYLDEFVGPSRNYWTDYRIRWYRALYQFFPREIRYFDSFAMPIQEEDPSEAIRSDEILSRLLAAFDIEHLRGYGGNILAMLFPDLHVERLTDDQVQAMINAERALFASGAAHFHAVIVARKKRTTPKRLLGRARYAVEERLPRVTQEARAFIRYFRERKGRVRPNEP